MTAHRQAIKLALADQTMNGEHPQLNSSYLLFQAHFVLILTLAQLDRLNCRRAGSDSSAALAAATEDRCTDTGYMTDLIQSQILPRHQAP